MRRLTSAAGRLANILSPQVSDSQGIQSTFVSRPLHSREKRRVIVRIRAASLAILLTAFATLAVIGCTTQGFAPQATALDAENPGAVMGGLKPVTGSSLQMYAVLATREHNIEVTSILTQPVVSNRAGNFSVYGKFSCPGAASEVYLVATGGNPGVATGNNPDTMLLSALGPCSDITAQTPIVVNEVTTVAAAAAIAPFLDIDRTSILTGTPAQLKSAFQLATNFANAATGAAPGTGIPPGYTAPVSAINTLANLVSTCVYSGGGHAGDSTPCGKFFTYATESGHTPPTNTLQALLNILQNPTHNIDALYSLTAPAVNTEVAPALPFAPQLTAPPPTWSINLIGEASTPIIQSSSTSGEATVTLADAYPTAALYYTLDGSSPTASSTRYAGPITLTASATIRAIAVVGTDISSIASDTITVTPTATKLVFVTEPQSTFTTGTLSASVALEDADGNVVPTAKQPVTLALGANPSGAALTGTLTATPVNGVATFNGVSLGTPGEGYTLIAKSSPLTAATSSAFDITLPYPDLPSVQAHSAASFVSSVGINTHFDYYGSIYTNNTPLMIQSLQTLGITHLRDAMCWQGPETFNTYYQLHQQLASLGFKTDFITAYNQPAAQISAYPALVADAEAVEPANEYDISGDLNWAADITAQQQLLYRTIQSSPYASSIKVLAPSLAFPWNAPLLGNVSAISSAGNLHGYFGGYNPVSANASPASYLSQIQSESSTQPVWVTETGYFAQPGPFAGSYGVDLATQAVYLPRTLLEYFNAGAARTYLYELADDVESGEDPANYHWGLLDSSGNPKPAFHAVANLLNTLADADTNFTPSTLAFNLQGAGSNVHHTLLQKSDGTFYLAVWIEASGYSFLTQQDLTVPAQKVNLQLNATPASAQSIQWDATGAATTANLIPTQSIPITVSDKLQIIKLVLK